MFDTIQVYQRCPYCGGWQGFAAQTKDLFCIMSHYTPLNADWETSDLGKKMRTGLPVFPQFPLDKTAKVWRDQAELIEARATIPEEYHGKLNYVSVIVHCEKCGVWFRGKVVVKDGKLWGTIYECQKGA